MLPENPSRKKRWEKKTKRKRGGKSSEDLRGLGRKERVNRRFGAIDDRSSSLERQRVMREKEEKERREGDVEHQEISRHRIA